MKCEIFCVGSELLSGRVNTNVAYLCDKVASIGGEVTRQTTLPDSEPVLVKAFSRALERAQVIISTGGLGPTFDDVTREAWAAALGKKLVFDPKIQGSIQSRLAKVDVEMSEHIRRQAYILEGARALMNTVGTAPGQLIAIPDTDSVVVMLPGPPHELAPMVEQEVLPFLHQRFGRAVVRRVTMHSAGLFESQVDEKLRKIPAIKMTGAGVHDGVTARQEKRPTAEGIYYTVLAGTGGVDVVITCIGEDEMDVERRLKNSRKQVQDLLGKAYFGDDGHTLESDICDKMTHKRQTLSVAESCTGGLVANRITNVSGSSLYFMEGMVTYSNASKIRLLGVSKATLEKHGAVSRQCALEMARGMRAAAGTDFALAVTGICGPKPSSTGKPVGLVFIALAASQGESCDEAAFAGSRIQIKERIATAALNKLRLTLITKSR